MNLSKTISFIIPCYNVELYIERCYKSLSKQVEAEDVEFIFVNDGSKDKTLEILERIKSVDNRVILINQDNLGVSVARNKALEISKGDYIYLLDSDDYLSSDDVVSAIKSIIKIYNSDIIMPSYNIDNNNTIYYRKIPLRCGLITKHELFQNSIVFPTDSKLVYKASIIRCNCLSFDANIKCGEVYAFTINYLRKIDGKNIYITDKPFQNYYMRIDSAVHKPNYNSDITVTNALHSIYNNGENLINYGSFIVTAFRLMRSFTYSRYLKYPLDKKVIETLQYVLSDKIVRQCIKDTVYKPHREYKERLIALYIYIMPQLLGIKLLNYFLSKK